MNFKFLLIIVLFLTIQYSYAQPSVDNGRWEVVEGLTDEFNEFDTNKWFKPGWNYGLPNSMDNPENSGVTDGELWIKATYNAGSERWFESNRIQSRAQISYPMYTECSMKASTISALNTFWMNNGDNNERDEIDICENNAAPTGTPSLGAETPFTNASNWWRAENGEIWNGNNLGDTDNHNSTNDLSDENPMKGLKMDEAYHIIGCHWIDEKTFHWYLDGEHVGTSVIQDPQMYFSKRLNIIWDLWTNIWDGFATPSSLQNDDLNTMYVDWIHTYKLIYDGSTVTDEFSLGNSTNNDGGNSDGWSSNMVINKSDTFTNTTDNTLKIDVEWFNFYANKENADPITPFVVKINGDNDFTVIKIGKTATDYSIGNNASLFFIPEEIPYILVEPGETIAPGFIDANPDGTGGGNGSVISHDINEPTDEIWYSGGLSDNDSGSISLDNEPIEGTTTTTLNRNYQFNITFEIIDDGTTASIVENNSNNKTFNSYPNPATDILNITLSDTIENDLNLLDITGRVLLTKKISQSSKIDISSIPAGIYILKVGNRSQKLIIK